MRRTAGRRRHPAGADGAGAAPRDRARSALLRTGVPVALVLALVAGGTLTSRAAIDPNQVTRLTPQGLARGDQFGFSVALSGTTLAVGSPRDDDDAGRVTIFERGSGAWVEVATVLPQGGAPGSQFGYAVDLDGSTLAVGAARADGDRGAVYVFTRDSSGAWSQQARLGGVNPGDELGYAVALEGDTLAAGAPFAAGAGGAERGALTVYERSGGSWSEAASVLGLDTGPGDRFGNAASLSGSTLLVGAAHARQDGNASTGAAYVFVRGAGGWGQQAKLVDSQPAAFDKLGRAVALDGDVALVGVPHDDDVATDGGAALVFLRTGTSWAQQAKLAPGDLVSGAYFGRALVLSGTTALVGSPFATSGGSAQAGAAYTFTSSGGQWTQQARFAAAPPSASAEYGRSLALEGDTAVVGEPEVNGYRGAAHVYEATTAPPTTSPSTTSPSTTAPPTTAPPTTAPPTTAPPTTAPPTTVPPVRTRCFGELPTIMGTEGDDVIVGTSGPDVIMALGGDDVILGLEGDDLICAGDGNDGVIAGDGDDLVDAGTGDDAVVGRTGNDSIRGSSGDDRIGGGAGDDRLAGGPGDDQVYGGPGTDACSGGSGADTIIACE